MDEYAIWYIASDRGVAEVLAERAAVAGIATTLVEPAAGLEPPATAAPVTIAVVSAAALTDRGYDGVVTARLDAGQPILFALDDVSAWEFALRRPRWVSQVDPAQVLDGTLRASQTAWFDWLASASAAPPARRRQHPASNEPAAGGSLTISTEPPPPTEPSPESLVDPSVLLRPPAWLAGVAARDVTMHDEQPSTPAPAPADPPRLSEAMTAPVTAPPDSQGSAPAAAATPAIVPPRRQRPGRRQAPSTPVSPGAGRAPAPATRPRPRRSAGCTCLLWALGLVVAGVVVLGLAIGALVAFDGPEEKQVATSVSTALGDAAPATSPQPGGATATSTMRAPTVTPIRTPSRTPSAVATRAATATAQTSTTRPPAATGTVGTAAGARLLRDSFTNPGQGVLPRAAADGASYRLGYEQGEYVMAASPGATPALMTAALPDSTADAIVAIDARLIADPADRTILLTCRDQGTPTTAGYSLRVNPERGQASLVRWEQGRETPLVGWRTMATVRQNNQTNRLELRCLNVSITGVVNGVTVASAIDQTYRAGVTWVGATTSREAGEARFDNLSVTALAPAD